MVIVRFLLRFLLIPLGLVVSALAVTAVSVALSWSKFVGLVFNDSADAIVAVLFAGPMMFLALASVAFAMMLPALLGIAVAEIAAIRSWLYFAATGAAAAWIGWWGMAGLRADYAVFNEPTLMAAAGIAGGLAYWAVAGWNAGFWKPVFASAQTQQPAARPPAA